MLTLTTGTEKLEHSDGYEQKVSDKDTTHDNLPKLQHKIRIQSQRKREALSLELCPWGGKVWRGWA